MNCLPSLFWFHFCSHSLQLKFLVPTVDLCSGKFCDGQAAGSTTCVCVEKSGIKEWGIRAVIHSEELDITRTSHQKSTFTSVAFAKLCVLNSNVIRPQDATFNLIHFRRNIKEFIVAINNQEQTPGFEVMGWFKPSKQEGESFFEVHEYHIISVKPLNNSLPDAVLKLRHPRPPVLSAVGSSNNTFGTGPTLSNSRNLNEGVVPPNQDEGPK